MSNLWGSVSKDTTNLFSGRPSFQVGQSASDEWRAASGHNHDSNSGDVAAAQMQQNAETQYGKNKEYTGQLGANDQRYLGQVQGAGGQYQQELDRLAGQAGTDQGNATAMYKNTISPQLQSLMDRGKTEAGSAMTLQQAMDPNNAVAAGTRKLYNDTGASQRASYSAQGAAQRAAYNAEGDTQRKDYNDQGANVQKQYEQQAQNEGKQGLADVGVMGALGMQNMAGQLGGVPMTGGQLQALMGSNMAQAGSAYAGTQKRQQSLRDSGIQGNIGLQNTGLGRSSDLRTSGLGREADMNNMGLGRESDLQTQGLGAGFQRSDTAYGQGRQAIGDYNDSINNFESAADRQMSRDKDFRQQLGGYAGQSYGLQQQMADTERGVGNTDVQRQMANYNTYMGGGQANLGAQIQGYNAQQAAQAAQNTGIAQAGTTAVGTYFGGPAVGSVAGQGAKAAGDSAAPASTAVPQYGNYNNTQQMGPSAAYSNMGPDNYQGMQYGGGPQSPQQGLGLYDDQNLQARMRA